MKEWHLVGGVDNETWPQMARNRVNAGWCQPVTDLVLTVSVFFFLKSKIKLKLRMDMGGVELV